MTDRELLNILLDKPTFEFVNYENILVRDGIYYMSYNPTSTEHVKQVASFLMDTYDRLPVICIKNGSPIRFGNNFNPSIEEINKAKELYKNTEFTFII